MQKQCIELDIYTFAGLKWHEGDWANPNRCKVDIGLMHEGSARAGITAIGGMFLLNLYQFGLSWRGWLLGAASFVLLPPSLFKVEAVKAHEHDD